MDVQSLVKVFKAMVYVALVFGAILAFALFALIMTIVRWAS